ncbi:Glycerol-3-phosphate dehydrogenase [NAD(+)] [Mycena chlorophos]|uniref:Glycerol-3-phosphate dehydrogenase [NAD(+)] n=1 Tax=Mycena chlorophos TaxID=658473 RepID=A0A8H6W9W1_MYCCL|nr:Glycerol-3-phosphate dehydrogenase [NAD(+)] [Mycena chlorophos]
MLHSPRALRLRSRSPARRRFSFSLHSLSFPFKMATSKAQPESNSRVLILGAGNFGSCLAEHLGDSDHRVFLWAREQSVVEHFNATRKHLKYLPSHTFSSNVSAVGPALPDAAFINSMDVLLFAIPTQFLRDNLTKLQPALSDKTKLPLLIFVNKGIEIGTDALTLEIIADTCGADVAKAATFISGPSFAKEIVLRRPTSVSVVSFTEAEADKTAALFHQPHFRCYTGSDPVGVELSGALKNVYAIAAGKCILYTRTADEFMASSMLLTSPKNTVIITRGLAEMTCIGTAYGASPLTFLGLAGVGDLFLTCSSSSSRNYTVGYRLGQGETLETIIATLGSVAEGVSTAKSVRNLVTQLGVQAPIAERVYEVLYEGACGRVVHFAGVNDVPGKSTGDAVAELMALPPSREIELATIGRPAEKLLHRLGM